MRERERKEKETYLNRSRIYLLFQIRKKRNLAELAVVTNPIRQKN